MLTLQEPFIIIRRKKDDCDGRGRRGFKGGTRPELAGLLWMGLGRQNLENTIWLINLT